MSKSTKLFMTAPQNISLGNVPWTKAGYQGEDIN